MNQQELTNSNRQILQRCIYSNNDNAFLSRQFSLNSSHFHSSVSSSSLSSTLSTTNSSHIHHRTSLINLSPKSQNCSSPSTFLKSTYDDEVRGYRTPSDSSNKCLCSNSIVKHDYYNSSAVLSGRNLFQPHYYDCLSQSFSDLNVLQMCFANHHFLNEVLLIIF